MQAAADGHAVRVLSGEEALALRGDVRPLTDDWASYHLSLCVRRTDPLPTATRLLFQFLREQAAEP